MKLALVPEGQVSEVTVTAAKAARASPEQLADCKALMAMLERVTNEQPTMWGPSIVGFALV